jgi:hypothetical protein
MQADFPVLLDACVLAPPRLSDLLFRLAEYPRLYLPKWTDQILDEVKRTQINKLRPSFSEKLADYWRAQVTAAFPEAMVEGYQHLIPLMQNQEKDRHVLAAAVYERVNGLITFNIKDFQSEQLNHTWRIAVLHPQDFLLDLYGLNPSVFAGKLSLMAAARGESVHAVLAQFRKQLPVFAERVLQDMGLTT